MPLEKVSGFPDFPLPGQENQDVPARINSAQPPHGVSDPLVQVPVRTLGFILIFGQRLVHQVNRVTPAGYLDHRRAIEMPGKLFCIDCRGGNQQLEVRASRQQGFQISQQEVDIQAALVRLVDDDGVVGVQVAVMHRFRQQNTIGHELDVTTGAAAFPEPHLVTYHSAQITLQFFGYPFRHGPCSDPSWLGTGNQATRSPAGLEAEFG